MGGIPLQLKPVDSMHILGKLMPSMGYDHTLGHPVQLYADSDGKLFCEQRVMAASLEESQMLGALYEKRQSISHTNLAAIRAVLLFADFCLYGVQLYREYLPISLRDEISVRRLQQRRFEEEEVLQLVRNIARAVEALEEHDVVWGWIEPVNIKRGTNNVWVLQDFGYPFTVDVGDIGRNLNYLLGEVMPDDCKHYTDKLRKFQRQVKYYSLDQINTALKHWSLLSTLPELQYVSPVANRSRHLLKSLESWE